MIRDLLRFYRNAPKDLAMMGSISLDDYLERNGYGRAFREDHLYPMAAAIWSTPAMEVGRYPAASFVRFCCNHGLLDLRGRPVWRTVAGGSREYVKRITKPYADKIRLSTPVRSVRRAENFVELIDADGVAYAFDDVVIATHADQALRMLADPSVEELRILGAFQYSRNEAVLHHDASLMPKRRAAWSSWNYLTNSATGPSQPSITYWMNRLQSLGRLLRHSLRSTHVVRCVKIWSFAARFTNIPFSIWQQTGRRRKSGPCRGSVGHGSAARILDPAFMKTAFRQVSQLLKIWAGYGAHGR